QRLAPGFSADVPQRHVDARHGRRLDRPAPPIPVAVHPLPEEFAVERILAEDEFLEISDRADDATGFARQRALAPAEDAVLVGLDFDQRPVRHRRRDRVWFDGRDLHGWVAGISPSLVGLASQNFWMRLPCTSPRNRLPSESTVIACAQFN